MGDKQDGKGPMPPTGPAKEGDWNLASYHYHLPPELVALRPMEPRDGAALMVYRSGHNPAAATISDFRHLGDFLPDNSLLIFNDTKVFPCRVLGQKKSGGQAEMLFLSPVPKPSLENEGHYQALIRSRGKKKIGDEYHLPSQHQNQSIVVKITAVDATEGFLLSLSWMNGGELQAGELAAWLNQHGLIPIPPYIRDGQSDEQDKSDYQTVYANQTGSAAAPTAGLHFTEELLQHLKKQGHQLGHVTLHVGPGTFRPVQTQDIRDHAIHREAFSISSSTWQQIQEARAAGRPIIAVGTTSLRTLESAFHLDHFIPDHWYDTEIFLYPGKKIHSAQGLITNFHLPESSLLMLVSAAIGREETLALYRLAVEKRLRFYSYGDGMLLTW